jgi:menaquinol-cytochrome c reductase iron-sulfur subunit
LEISAVAETASNAPPQSPGDIDPARRDFFAKLSLWLGALGAAIVGIPVIGFLLEPLFRVPGSAWLRVGEQSKFQRGKTVEVTFEDASSLPWAGVTAKTGAWLRLDEAGKFTAFAVNCTHLGCPVRWLETAELFMCPCHGGVYYKDGTVAAGPPPRPLTQYPVRIRDGNVEVQAGPTPIT